MKQNFIKSSGVPMMHYWPRVCWLQSSTFHKCWPKFWPQKIKFKSQTQAQTWINFEFKNLRTAPLGDQWWSGSIYGLKFTEMYDEKVWRKYIYKLISFLIHLPCLFLWKKLRSLAIYNTKFLIREVSWLGFSNLFNLMLS